MTDSARDRRRRLRIRSGSEVREAWGMGLRGQRTESREQKSGGARAGHHHHLISDLCHLSSGAKPQARALGAERKELASSD
jgi:hypothetical protein